MKQHHKDPVKNKKRNQQYSGWKEIPSGNAPETIVPGCIVLEGGAFRGLYNQGVLDALMEKGINMYCTIGVSAGALAGFNYVSGQIGRSARANLRFRHYTDYVGRGALRHSHSPIRLDFLFKDYNRFEPFNKKRFFDPSRRYIAVATNCRTGKTEYFERGKCRDIVSAIKASASMPFISPMISVDGIPCLDGGCSCKIPYRWAIDQGFEKIVIVRTRDPAFRKKVRKIYRLLRFYRKYPEFAESLRRSSRDYNRQCDEIEQLEKEGRAFVLKPSGKVKVSRLEGDMEKLGALYWQGYNDTMNKMTELKEYLGLNMAE